MLEIIPFPWSGQTYKRLLYSTVVPPGVPLHSSSIEGCAVLDELVGFSIVDESAVELLDCAAEERASRTELLKVS